MDVEVEGRVEGGEVTWRVAFGPARLYGVLGDEQLAAMVGRRVPFSGGEGVALDGVPLPDGEYECVRAWIEEDGSLVAEFRSAAAPAAEGADGDAG